MRRAARQNGSVSAAALVLLVILSAFSAASVALLRALQSYERRSEERSAGREELRRIAEETIKRMTQDPTPLSDSPLDPVWAWIGMPREDGVTVELEDISSALNPNWIQKNILAKTGLGDLLFPGRSPDELQQRREDEGFFTDILRAYGDLFREGALEAYFSGYGYANVNTTDEFALRKLYLLRTGDAVGSEEFHARIQEALVARRIVGSEELQSFLGEAYAKLYPVVNAEPILNVHFADPLVLGELLAYPDWGVRDPQEALGTLISTRQGAELTAQELRRIIGEAHDSRIHQYLGVRSWFWKVTVSRGAERLEIVLARLPPEAEEESPRLLVVEERHSP